MKFDLSNQFVYLPQKVSNLCNYNHRNLNLILSLALKFITWIEISFILDGLILILIMFVSYLDCGINLASFSNFLNSR